MSLETPIKIRMLQRKLYQKAKEEPSYRFYLLYDKMYREDVLAHAYALVRSNQGAPGVDGQSFWGIESKGLEEWLSGIREDLRAKTYRSCGISFIGKIIFCDGRNVRRCRTLNGLSWVGKDSTPGWHYVHE